MSVMRICIIAGGHLPIPPTGWGGIEGLVWNYKCELEAQGHEVLVINTLLDNDLNRCDPALFSSVIKTVNDWNPGFVHLQYDHYADMMPYIAAPRAMTSHYPYLDYPNKRKNFEWIFHKFAKNHSYVFPLSDRNSDHFKSSGVNESLLWTWVAGVHSENFKFTEDPKKNEKTICLGKIEPRKRQAYLQQLDENIDFAGPLVDGRFNRDNSSYLGEWPKERVCHDLTEYANLILFSEGEAAPAVTLEALVAGCGLVVSNEATANLDTSLPFIDVVDLSISPTELKETIRKNRIISIENRKEIRRYGIEMFDIKKCVSRYVDKIIELCEKTNVVLSGDQT